MKTVKGVLILMAAFALVGCKSTYLVQNYQAPANRPQPGEGIYIVVPPDAYDEPGSGKLAATTLESAFRTHANRVEQSTQSGPLTTHLSNAAAGGFTYVLDSTIHSWEEEPTEWTGKSDQVDMTLRLLHAPDGAVKSETRFRGNSKWLTFGGDHVQDLLDPLARGWVRAIYEGTDFSAPDLSHKSGK